MLPDFGAYPRSIKRGNNNSREQNVVVYIENLDAFKSWGQVGFM